MINKVKDMIFYNLKELIIFQLVFKVTSFLIFMPLFLNLFNIIMKITGYEYLTLENILSFISNPIVIIMVILLILFMLVYTFFDLSTIIVTLLTSSIISSLTVGGKAIGKKYAIKKSDTIIFVVAKILNKLKIEK